MPLLKTLGLLFAAWLLIHWLTAGQDEIVQGPPEGNMPAFCTTPCK